MLVLKNEEYSFPLSYAPGLKCCNNDLASIICVMILSGSTKLVVSPKYVYCKDV